MITVRNAHAIAAKPDALMTLRLGPANRILSRGFEPVDAILRQRPCAKEDIIFINGINTPPSVFLGSMAALAYRANGARVMGVYNASDGPLHDWKQGFLDHIYAEDNKAIVSMAKLAERSIEQEKPVVFVAHSQGAALAAQALRIAEENLLERYTPEHVEHLLTKVRVETYAAAGSRFIDGPQYVHYINTADPVPHVLGLAGGLRLATTHYPGKNAVFRYFTDIHPHHPGDETSFFDRLFSRLDNTVHTMYLYAEHRVPFAKAYAAGTISGGKAEQRAEWHWSPMRFLNDLITLPLTVVHVADGTARRGWWLGRMLKRWLS